MVIVLNERTRNTLPAINSIADIYGAGGMVAYSGRQDLLVLSDFYSAFALEKASIYLDAELLDYIAECARVYGIWPGAQIIYKWVGDYESLLDFPSAIADRSSFMHDVANMLHDQKAIDKKHRTKCTSEIRKKVYPSKEAPLVEVRFPSSKKVLIRHDYLKVLTEFPPVEVYSAAKSGSAETTKSWKELSPDEKGIYVELGDHLYGVIMPYA